MPESLHNRRRRYALRRKPKPVHAYSKVFAASGTALDRRTVEGKFLEDTRIALLNQCGPDPTPAQQLLCQMAAVKAVRCELLVRIILGPQPKDKPIKDNREHHALAWMNGLRRDLVALGLLIPPDAPPLPDIHQYLAAKHGDAAEPAE
jgi:hypothetical protein